MRFNSKHTLCSLGMWAFPIVIILMQSCSSKSGDMNSGAPSAATQQGPSSNSGSSSGSSNSGGSSSNTSSGGSQSSGSNAEDGDWNLTLGYDGTNDFSSLAPVPASVIEVSDASIVKVETVKYKYSAEMINAIIEDFKKDLASATAEEKKQAPTEDQLRQYLSMEQEGSRIVPLKAGNATLKFKAEMASGGQEQQGSEPPPPPMTVHVVAYTPAQIELGKKRYASAGSGTTRACLSCHGGTTPSAPPHQLGNVAFASDAKIITWLKEGKPFWPASAGAPASTVEHKWEFASSDEEIGMVGYLRTLQEKNMEALAKLEMDYFNSMQPAK